MVSDQPTMRHTVQIKIPPIFEEAPELGTDALILHFLKVAGCIAVPVTEWNLITETHKEQIVDMAIQKYAPYGKITNETFALLPKYL